MAFVGAATAARIMLALLVVSSAPFSSADSVTFFSYPSNSSRLAANGQQHVSVGADGSLVLDGTTGGSGNGSSGTSAVAIHESPVAIYDAATRGLRSFLTVFTFTTNSSSNGTLALVVVPDAGAVVAGGLAAARSAVSVEFNTECAAAGGPNFSDPGVDFGRGRGGGGRGGYFGYGPGGPGHYAVVDYVNGSALAPDLPAYAFNGTAWLRGGDADPDSRNGTCTLPNPNSYPGFLFQVAVQYNATSGRLLVGSPTCGAGPRVLLLNASATAAADNSSGGNDLPPGLFSADPYVGFVGVGGLYNVSAWNFSADPTVDVFTSLGVSSVTGAPVGLDNGGGGGGGSPADHGHGNGGLSHGARIGIAVAGAVVGLALLLALLLCCCRNRRRSRGQSQSQSRGLLMKAVPAADSANAASSSHYYSRGDAPISDRALVFDAVKNNSATAHDNHNHKHNHSQHAEHDTAPLTTAATITSSASVTTASWAPPTLAPR